MSNNLSSTRIRIDIMRYLCARAKKELGGDWDLDSGVSKTSPVEIGVPLLHCEDGRKAGIRLIDPTNEPSITNIKIEVMT